MLKELNVENIISSLNFDTHDVFENVRAKIDKLVNKYKFSNHVIDIIYEKVKPCIVSAFNEKYCDSIEIPCHYAQYEDLVFNIVIKFDEQIDSAGFAIFLSDIMENIAFKSENIILKTGHDQVSNTIWCRCLEHTVLSIINKLSKKLTIPIKFFDIFRNRPVQFYCSNCGKCGRHYVQHRVFAYYINTQALIGSKIINTIIDKYIELQIKE